MTNTNEQTNAGEDIRLLDVEEIAQASGAAANCRNGRMIFDLGWLALELIECDDGSYSYGVVTREFH